MMRPCERTGVTCPPPSSVAPSMPTYLPIHTQVMAQHAGARRQVAPPSKGDNARCVGGQCYRQHVTGRHPRISTTPALALAALLLLLLPTPFASALAALAAFGAGSVAVVGYTTTRSTAVATATTATTATTAATATATTAATTATAAVWPRGPAFVAGRLAGKDAGRAARAVPVA